MTNLFKTRYLPNSDGTESTTALTNVNTVFIHTYLGDDNTGKGTRENPYRSMTKASLKSGTTYVLFRGVINEYASTTKTIIGDDINQNLIFFNYSPLFNSISNLTVDKIRNGPQNQYLTRVMYFGVDSYSPFYVEKMEYCFFKNPVSGGTAYVKNAHHDIFSGFSNLISYSGVSYKNSIYIKFFDLKTITSNFYFSFNIFSSSTIFKYNGTTINPQPTWTNNSAANVQLLRNAYLAAGMSQANVDLLFHIDGFGNETCKVIWEIKDGGSHPNIFNKYDESGNVLDFTLNPDPQNEALWASDTGGYVGCFRPAYACDVETGLSAISNVDENGANSGSGDLFQIVNGELKFNSASSQLWNRMSDTTTINIPNGSNFKGLNAMSQDGSSFGYYIGKKQTLISPTAIAAGNALTVGKWYKVYNDNGNSVSEAIIYNGVQYLPEYTFLCVTGVTTFSTLEPGSGSYVKEILSGVLESIEILPYNDMTTPSTFPKFSAPLMGECKLIFYTASGAARYGKTAGDPVTFADLDLANMLTDFGTVKNKISYYDTWAISNADSEFYLLTNAGLSTTLKGYFTQEIPAIKCLRREINGHFDMPYDY